MGEVGSVIKAVCYVRVIDLTLGKIYDVLVMGPNDHNGVRKTPVYRLVNDIGVACNYPRYCFKTILEYREEQLKKLGM